MAIAKKQGEVTVITRVVATDTNGVVSAANITVALDEFVIDGKEQAVAGLNGGLVTALNNAIEALYNNVKGIS